MRTINALVAGLIIFFLACGGDKGTGADKELSLLITPDSLTIDRYDEVDFSVEIENVNSMFVVAFNFVIEGANADILDVTIPSSEFLGGNAMSFYEEIYGGVSVSVGHTQSDGDDNISGSGTICNIKIRWFFEGNATIQLKNIAIVNDMGENVQGLTNIKTNISQIKINR